MDLNQEKSQLTNDEIALLYRFVKQKYVRHKDVQFELVDHLASSIEEQRKTTPGISFEKALENEYAKFPITGFAKLVEAKSNALIKFWQKRIFQFMFKFISWPKAILTFLFTISLFNIIQWNGDLGLKICLVLLGVLIFGMVIKMSFTQSNNEHKIEEYLVVKTYYNVINSVFIFIYIVISILIKMTADEILANSFTVAIFTFFIVVFGIFTYGFFFSFPIMLKEEIKAKYGHFMLS